MMQFKVQTIKIELTFDELKELVSDLKSLDFEDRSQSADDLIQYATSILGIEDNM